MRKDLKWIVGSVFAAAVGAAMAFHIKACGVDLYCDEFLLKGVQYYNFYAANLRASLFAGFLTLGGFLMSLKTFIVVNMKKEVFDKPEYRKHWESARRNNPKTDEFRFAPLRYLAATIFVSIVASISTATLQLTIGLIPSFWSMVICLLAGAISIALILRSLVLIRKNLNRMFDFLDEEQREQERQKPEQEKPKPAHQVPDTGASSASSK